MHNLSYMQITETSRQIRSHMETAWLMLKYSAIFVGYFRNIEITLRKICDAMRDFVPFVQF